MVYCGRTGLPAALYSSVPDAVSGSRRDTARPANVHTSMRPASL